MTDPKIVVFGATKNGLSTCGVDVCSYKNGFVWIVACNTKLMGLAGKYCLGASQVIIFAKNKKEERLWKSYLEDVIVPVKVIYVEERTDFVSCTEEFISPNGEFSYRRKVVPMYVEKQKQKKNLGSFL